MAPLVRSEARSVARIRWAGLELASNRTVHPAVTLAFLVALAAMAIAIGQRHHVVIAAIFAGFGASLYCIVHELSATRSHSRIRSPDSLLSTTELEVKRCEYCGAPMYIRATWPTCDFCAATCAPTRGLDALLENRAADAQREANEAVEALQRTHQRELDAATDVAVGVVVTITLALVVASLL